MSVRAPAPPRAAAPAAGRSGRPSPVDLIAWILAVALLAGLIVTLWAAAATSDAEAAAGREADRANEIAFEARSLAATLVGVHDRLERAEGAHAALVRRAQRNARRIAALREEIDRLEAAAASAYDSPSSGGSGSGPPSSIPPPSPHFNYTPQPNCTINSGGYPVCEG